MCWHPCHPMEQSFCHSVYRPRYIAGWICKNSHSMNRSVKRFLKAVSTQWRDCEFFRGFFFGGELSFCLEFEDQSISITFQCYFFITGMYNTSEFELFWEERSPITLAPELHLTEYVLLNMWTNKTTINADLSDLRHGAFGKCLFDSIWTLYSELCL